MKIPWRKVGAVAWRLLVQVIRATAPAESPPPAPPPEDPRADRPA